ncbi:MAG: aminopeptidase P family protein [Actinobacteria bacterium]|jgi:Xaa-Pro aminopeptidase|nr:MAG: aminopeptidase P family protein [Actinomycetota bacterium]
MTEFITEVDWGEQASEAPYPTIPKAEFELRNARARELMEERGMDAMILFAPANVYYFTGFRDPCLMETHRWRYCAILPREGETVLIVENVFNNNARQTTHVKDVRTWCRIKVWWLPVTFQECLVNTLRDLGLAGGVLGWERGDSFALNVALDELDSFHSELATATRVAADPVIWGCRMIKTEWEIALIRDLCDRATRCVRTGFEAIKPGATERDIQRAMWQRWMDEDMFDCPVTMSFVFFSSPSEQGIAGWRYVSPQADRVLKEGDTGFYDCGPTMQGYWTDFQRIFHIGEPPQRQKDLVKMTLEAYRLTIDNIKPGMRACDVWDLAHRAIIAQEWMQSEPIDFVGHGIGLGNHEYPWLSDDDFTVIQPGMVLCVEMGCYDIPALMELGYMIEDIYLVKDDGLELLTGGMPQDMWVAK